MLPLSMVPWHTEYCELKKSEKKEEEGLSVLPLPLFPQIAHKPLSERCPPYTLRRGASLSPSWRHREDSGQMGLAKFLRVYDP